jgi:hypothetical protein
VAGRSRDCSTYAGGAAVSSKGLAVAVCRLADGTRTTLDASATVGLAPYRMQLVGAARQNSLQQQLDKAPPRVQIASALGQHRGEVVEVAVDALVQ